MDGGDGVDSPTKFYLIIRWLFNNNLLSARIDSDNETTQLWNAPAHATYTKLGFRPRCVLVGRTLDLNTLDKL